MSDPNDIVIAELCSRLITNRPDDRPIAVPRDMPGTVIFLSGVSDPGALYESAESGLLQGMNERLHRPDLCAGRYGADFAAARDTPVERLSALSTDRLDDPIKLHSPYQDNLDNRLGCHFAKGGGFFANAIDNLLEMFGESFNKFTQHVANRTQPKSQFASTSPPRHYSILAAHRLAMLISEARRLALDEAIKYGAPGGGL
jgi:hypothetical protein